MPIIKKTSIDNSIFKELNEKYPPIGENNGVAYKQKLEYLTFETDFLSDTTFRDLRDKYGNDIIAVIFYLRTEMCKNGWKVRIDNNYYNRLITDCSYACNIEGEKVHAMVQDLINSRIFFQIQDTNFEEGEWLTCPQQIYNYEMACNNRKKSRERSAEKRKRQAAQQHPVVDFPSNTPQQSFDLSEATNDRTIKSEADPFN